MVAAFSPAGSNRDHGDIAQRRGDFRHHNPPLRFFVVTRKAATRNRRLFGQQRHAIMAFLPVIKHVVAELRHSSGERYRHELCLRPITSGWCFSTMASSGEVWRSR